MPKMNYDALLAHSYEVTREDAECGPQNRLEYLADYIFDFTTYDGAMSELFARKAVEVCTAITARATFDYIKLPENYAWYLLLCNMPFFAERLSWGTSIRGAWWSAHLGQNFELDSCGLWDGQEQLADTIYLSAEEWTAFVQAVIAFASPEMSAAAAPLALIPLPERITPAS